MKNLLYLFIALLFIGVLSCDETDSLTGPEETPNLENPEEPIDEIEAPEGYSLVWSDEFDSTAINMDNWNYEKGDGTDFDLPAGWGNNELQIYTDSPDNSSIVTVNDTSMLSITALSDGMGSYTSAKLTTKEKISVRFGRVDVRAKMPSGQGVWPAIWMLGDNRGEVAWPGCGEIDIVEVLGHNTTTMHSTLHYTNGQNTKGETQHTHELTSGDLSTDFHVFSLEWTNETISFLLDGTHLADMPIEEDMKEFKRSFYLIMNVAIGGYWPGNPNSSTTFPQSMIVDYIRVFSKDGYEAPTAPALVLEEETMGGVLPENIAYNGIKDGFNDLGLVDIIQYGAGGQPAISTSDTSLSGATSLVYNFPGGSWGGGYWQMDEARDMSGYSTLHFSIHKLDDLHTAEIKLESPRSNAAVFLVNYTPTEVENGFVEYTIPLSDFAGLDLTQLTIPFAMWNPQNSDAQFVPFRVLIDRLYFE